MTDKQITDEEVRERAMSCYKTCLEQLSKVRNDKVSSIQDTKIIRNILYAVGTILGKSEKQMTEDIKWIFR